MKNIFKKLYKSKFGRYVFVPLVLTGLWIGLTIAYVTNFDTSFSIWSYNHPKTDFTNIKFEKLHKEDTIAGNFTAKDKNLGIVSLRFQTYIRPPFKLEDEFLFRIREKGESKWYYQNSYRSGLIYDVPFFPFGIPQIANSKDKQYEFEVTSLKGSEVNAISISDRNPILVTKYKYTKEELISDKQYLLNFFIKKFYNALFTPDVWFSSLVYSLPLIFYVSWITFFERHIKDITKSWKSFRTKLRKMWFYKYVSPVFNLFEIVFIHSFDVMIIFMVFFDIFIIQITNDLVYLVMIALWVATLKRYKLKSKNSFVFALALLVMPPLFLPFAQEPIAEKAAIWAYMFLVAGMIQILMELKSEKLPKNRLKA